MSARNSRQAKAARRRARNACAVCGDAAYVTTTDLAYPALCRLHLAYAVSTIFVGDNPGLVMVDANERANLRERRRVHQRRQRFIDKHKKPKGPLDLLPSRRRGAENAVEYALAKTGAE